MWEGLFEFEEQTGVPDFVESLADVKKCRGTGASIFYIVINSVVWFRVLA
jgi:hypothetical protein